MKYIQKLSDGGWELTGYFDYLNANRDQMPLEALTFAIDQRNYALTSHQSLHDAWLEWFLISEPASGSRTEIRSIQIECRFLGPYHDQYIELKYFDVYEYKIIANQVAANPLVGHGDLLMHEMRMQGEYVAHEMVFSSGAVFEIVFRGFSHRLVSR